MKVVAGKNWDWILFKTDNHYVLSVLCGSVGVFNRDILLSVEEVNTMNGYNEGFLVKMVKHIRSKPTAYDERHINHFHGRKDVKMAVKSWTKNKTEP